jgi:crotonobetainyl-CoA:carnitine CoA-transferase CaiB-like acyl-CoA transferase
MLSVPLLTILKKIRVLDFSHVYYGPYATMILADLGADVIKVEPLWGEVAREYSPKFGGVSGVFHYLDRNKRGITLDLKSPEGKEIALELAKKSDVIIENFSRGAMDRLGLGYEDIKKIKPNIIYASLSGFGLDGPYAKRPSFASIASSMSGWYRLTGDLIDPEGPPVLPAEWHGDLDPGLYAVIGMMAALLHREWSGEGQLIDVSQLDCMIAQNGIPLTNYMLSGLLPWEQRAQSTALRFMGPFEASDGWVFIHTSPRMVDRLIKGMGVDELKSRETVEEWASQRKVDDIVNSLIAVGVPAAPINSLKEVVEDPHVKHRKIIGSIEHPEAGRVRSPSHPIKYSGVKPEMRSAAPLLGQHTDEVLVELLGYDKEKIRKLRGSKVIS